MPHDAARLNLVQHPCTIGHVRESERALMFLGPTPWHARPYTDEGHRCVFALPTPPYTRSYGTGAKVKTMRGERVSPLVYIVLVVWTIGICVAAFVWTTRFAVTAMAASFVVFAVLRATLPGGVLPHVRGRVFDVTIYMLTAGMLLFLSQWANTPQVF